MSKYSTDVIRSKTEGPVMTEVFSDANEKYVKTTVLHGKTSDNYVYIDAAYTTKIDKDALLDLCLKGVTILYDGTTYYTPVSFKEESGSVGVTFNSVTLYSSEYVAG